MKNHNENQKYLAELTGQLADENLSKIDFDKLQNWLGDQQEQLEAINFLSAELECLRADFIARIGGMIKATAVADRRSAAIGEGVKLIEELEKLSSTELVSCYGRVSAKFRDSFPGSLPSPLTGRARYRPAVHSGSNQIKDYK